MADGQTTNYKWVLPENHVNSSAWGGPLNANFQDIDGKLFADVGNMTAIKGYLNPNTLTLTRGPSINASVNFINSAAAAGKQMRWSLYESFGSETGANVGSDYSLNAYDDTGVMLRAQYVFSRATGAMTFNGVSASFSGTLSCKVTASITGTAPTDNIFTGFFNSAAVRQGYVGYINSNASMTLAKDGGTSIVLTSGIAMNGPTVITGALTGSSTAAFTGITGTSLQVNGNATITGNATVTGTVNFGGATLTGLTVNGSATITGAVSTGALTAASAQINGNLTATGTGTFGSQIFCKNQANITAATGSNNSLVSFLDSASTQQGWLGWTVADDCVNLVNAGGANIKLTSVATVNGAATINGNTTVNGTLTSTGVGTLGSTVGAGVASALVRNAVNITGATSSDNAYVNFYDNTAAAQGFVGWQKSSNNLLLQNTGGASITIGGTLAVTLTGNTTVSGTLTSTGAASFPTLTATGLTVNGAATINGNGSVNGTLTSTGVATLGSTVGAGVASALVRNAVNITGATSSDNAYVNFYDNTAAAQGFVGWQKSSNNLLLQNTGGASITIGGTLAVTLTGNTTVSGTLTSTGAASFPTLTATGLTVNGNATVNGTLTSTGAASFPALTATGLTVNGNGSITGALTVTGLAINGNGSITGTLGVNGAFTAGTTITAGGTIGCKSTVSVTAASASDNAVAMFYNSAGVRQGYCGWLVNGDEIQLVADGGPSIIMSGTNTIAVNGNVSGSGTATFTGITATGVISATGLAATQGAVTITGGSINPDPSVTLVTGGTSRANFYYYPSADQVIMNHQVSGGALVVDNVPNFIFNGVNAYKAGGGSWVATSDARIKKVKSDYELGLNEVLQLRPVVFTYKGNDAPPDGDSPHKHVVEGGKEFVGMIAQEVEAVFPSMVTKRDGFIDGEAVTDLRDLDTNELIFALVNSVKSLKAELDELKAARR